MRQSYRDAGEEVVDSLELGDIAKIYLRTETTKEGATRFHYSLDGRKYHRFGPEGVSNFWGFLGIRHALCCYNVIKVIFAVMPILIILSWKVHIGAIITMLLRKWIFHSMMNGKVWN